jgi:hypothetical protein
MMCPCGRPVTAGRTGGAQNRTICMLCETNAALSNFSYHTRGNATANAWGKAHREQRNQTRRAWRAKRKLAILRGER